jgi:hypothetical protein
MQVDFQRESCTSHDDEESLVAGISDCGLLQEQQGCLQASVASLRRESRELKAQISQKMNKQSDFRNQMNNHFESVAHQKQLLSTRAEGLEMEQRQLQALDAQHKQEERSLRPRIDEAVADHAATEARIQVLMDRLVLLLSSANAASTGGMTSQILEEFQSSLLNLDDKIQTGKARLEAARRENHDFAIRLSEEQSETKRLHDKLCSLQSRLYHGRLRKEAGDPQGESSRHGSWAEEDSSSQKPAAPSAAVEISSGGSERHEAKGSPAASVSAKRGASSRRSTQSTPSPAKENSAGDRKALEAMEETLKEALDRISFQEPVVRVKPWYYSFGPNGTDPAYLRRTSDGTVQARPGPNTSLALDGSDDWVPLEDFLNDLCLKHSREFELRKGNVVPDFQMLPDSQNPQHSSRPSVTAETAVTSWSTSEEDRDEPRANAGDDAAGYGGKTSAALEELKKTTELDQRA